MKKSLPATAFSILGLIAVFLYFAPYSVFILCSIVAVAAVVYFLVVYLLSRPTDSKGAKLYLPPLLLFFLVLPFLIGSVLVYVGTFSFLAVLLLVGLTLTFFSNFLMVPLALVHKSSEEDLSVVSYPSISVIVPAYNEEECIDQCLESLLETDYPEGKKEVIVVDDGSTDETLREARKFEKDNVKVVHKENGGKYSALNYGLMFAKGEIIVSVDADGIVSRKAIKIMATQLEKNKGAKAVSGNVRVLNGGSMLTRCQTLDYLIGINLLRRAFSFFGSVPVVPGSLGAFRRKAVRREGIFDPSITEDFDITIKLAKIGEIIQAPTEAFVYTRVPDSWTDLWNQRLRWYRGTFSSLIKHKNVFTNPRFGFLGRLTFPYLVLSLGIFPFIGLLVPPVTLAGLALGNIMPILGLLLFFLALNVLISLFTIQLQEKEDISLLLYVPILSIVYQQFLNFLKVKSLFDVARGGHFNW